MAHFNLDARTINNFANDDIVLELNTIIDNELAKDERDIDTDLVEECINALVEIEQLNNNAILVPLISSEEYLNSIHSALNLTRTHRLSRPMRVAMIAAIIASGTFTANAAVGAITGQDIISRVSNAIKNTITNDDTVVDDEPIVNHTQGTNDENISTTNNEQITSTTGVYNQTSNDELAENTSVENVIDDSKDISHNNPISSVKPIVNGAIELPPVSDEDETSIQPTSQIADVTPSSPSNIKNEKVELKNLYYNTQNFKSDYIYGEALDYSGLEMTAEFSDGTTKELKVKDCDFYTKAVDMNKTADYTLTILYKTASIKLNITVRPNEETRGSKICTNDIYTYLKTDEGAYIIEYLGSYAGVDVNYIDGIPVYAISSKMFKDTGLKYFSSNTVKKIMPSAFEGCNELFYFYAPEVEYVGDKAFKDCTKLEEFTLGKLSYIGESAFKNTSLKALTLSSKITAISNRMCENCSSLKTVTFEGKVTSIGNYAFSECEALEKVNGAGQIASVGKFGFYADENVEFDQFNSKLKSAGEGAFYACRNIDMGELNHLESIGAGAFERCTGLTGVTIPASMTSIPPNAFKTTNIKQITIPNTVKSVGEYAFMSTKLTTLTVPDSVTAIGTYAFYTVTLRNIYLPSSLSTIGSNAFYNGSRVKIYAPSGSYAEKYANDNSFAFVVKE